MRKSSFFTLVLMIFGIIILGTGCSKEEKTSPTGPGGGGGGFQLSDTLLNFGASTASLTFNISVSGLGDQSWTITSDQAWLTVSKTTGYTNDGDSTKVTVYARRSTLLEGDYTGFLTVTPQGGTALKIRAVMRVEPALILLSRDTLDFGSTHTQTTLQFDITNKGSGLLSWKGEVTDGADWLSLSADSGEVATAKVGNYIDKAVITVTANRGLENGAYSGMITVTSNGGTDSILVLLQVANPIMVITTDSLTFALTESKKNISVTNDGSSTLTWTASAERGKDWLTTEETRGNVEPTTSGEIVVVIDRKGLATGYYSGILTITPNIGQAKQVLVKMNVLGPTLSITVHDMDFGARDTVKGFEIKNDGGGLLQWQVTTTDSWLRVSRATGSTNALGSNPIVVSVNRNGLAHGGYTGYVKVTPDVSSPDSIKVEMTVAAPEPAKLVIGTNQLPFSNDKALLGFQISNEGDVRLDWSITESLDWLTVSPTQGSTVYGAPASISLLARRNGLGAGQYSGYVTITSNGGNDSVLVSMDVGAYDPPRLSLSPKSLAFAMESNQQTFTLTNLGLEPLDWNIRCEVVSGDWLKVNFVSGTTVKGSPATIMAIATRAGMAVGNYTGRIIVDGGAGGVDTVAVTIQIVTEPPSSYDRMVLIEDYTNTSCGPCATYTPNVVNAIASFPATKTAFIAFHVNWPGASDPWYVQNPAENRTMWTSRGVSGVPSFFIDGPKFTNIGSAPPVASQINLRLAKASPIKITITSATIGTNLSTTVSIESAEDLSNVKLYVGLVEVLVNYNAPNGSKQHHGSMLDMIATGEPINLTRGQTWQKGYSSTKSFTVTGHSVDPGNLQIIAWVQNSNNEVLNAGKAMAR